FFVRLQQPFVSGLVKFNGLWVYTSRGTGYWGPPKRLGAPSEITLVRLVASTAAWWGRGKKRRAAQPHPASTAQGRASRPNTGMNGRSRTGRRGSASECLQNKRTPT